MNIDVERLKAGVDLAEIVGRYVALKRNGPEFEGLCPFHTERTPSFTIIPAKGFVHCFGCGAHHDVIGFIMAMTGCDFQAACAQLGARDFAEARADVRRDIEAPLVGKWMPITPVPDDAPDIMGGNGWTVPIWNLKREKLRRMKPTRLDAYLNAQGVLLGYVLRADIVDRDSGAVKKWTPQVTWCVGMDGRKAWCLMPFASPRPLQGLDALAAKPDAPVLIVEGEKCRAAGAGAWPQYAVLTWPGGSNGLSKVDWRPLSGRDVVLWPDADMPGRKAMLGQRNDAGAVTRGVAMYAAEAGARSIRVIDTAGQPEGWDIDDALHVDRWTPRQLAAWAAARVIDVRVVRA